MLLYPLKIKPVYKNYIWGGRRLERLGRQIPPGKVAESWEASANADGPGTIENGKYEGIRFPELLRRFNPEIMGPRLSALYKDFPLLLKLIDADDRLSVQVHPGDRYASEHEGYPYGKSEMWFILSAKPDAAIIYGTKPGTDKKSFEQAITGNTLEELLNPVRVKAGDSVYIPAGKVHALNDGLLAAEIQQNSNLTYRIYDYGRADDQGRSRQLHVGKALDVMDFNGEYDLKYPGLCKGLRIGGGSGGMDSVIRIAAGRYFCIDLCRINGSHLEDTKGERFIIYMVIDGSANIALYNDDNNRLDTGSTKVGVRTGDTVLLPASPGKYITEGAITLLRVHVPFSREEAFEPLLMNGYSPEQISLNIGGAYYWDMQ